MDRSPGSFREFGAYEFLMPVASTISKPKLQKLINQMNKGCVRSATSLETVIWQNRTLPESP